MYQVKFVPCSVTNDELKQVQVHGAESFRSEVGVTLETTVIREYEMHSAVFKLDFCVRLCTNLVP